MPVPVVKREESEESPASTVLPVTLTDVRHDPSLVQPAAVNSKTSDAEDVKTFPQRPGLHDATRQLAPIVRPQLSQCRPIISTADRSAELLFGPLLHPRLPFEADPTLATRAFFPGLPKPSIANLAGPDNVVVPRHILAALQSAVSDLGITANNNALKFQYMLSDLIQTNSQMQIAVQKLDHSITTVIGSATGRLDALDAPDQNGHSSDNQDISLSHRRETVTTPNDDASGRKKRTRNRKKPDISIPGKLIIGPPVPVVTESVVSNGMANMYPSLPRTPFTPGRIGPNNQMKRSHTCVNKRGIHQLDKVMPPANVVIPNLPLTDTEVIVYFFNSLSRPIVSLRLYARNWGPAAITDTLNGHRGCDPPYLRNTCSVKCTTAINKGKHLYGGDSWKDTYTEVFGQAPDCKATDLIRFSENDEADAVDFEVRNLAVQLVQYPSSEDGGLFTRCVKYCAETNAPYTLSNVHHLAMDLTENKIPVHPPEPVYIAERSSSRKKSASAKKRAAESDDEIEELQSLTPRSSLRVPAKKSRQNMYSGSAIDESDVDEDLDSEDAPYEPEEDNV